MKTRKIARDARNGQFVPLAVARRRPRTTVVETIRAKERVKRQTTTQK